MAFNTFSKQREDLAIFEEEKGSYKQLDKETIANKEEEQDQVLMELEGKPKEDTTVSSTKPEEPKKQNDNLQQITKLAMAGYDNLHSDSNCTPSQYYRLSVVQATKLQEKIKHVAVCIKAKELPNVAEEMQALKDKNKLLLCQMHESEQLVMGLVTQNAKLSELLAVKGDLIQSLIKANDELLSSLHELFGQYQELLKETNDHCRLFIMLYTEVLPNPPTGNVGTTSNSTISEIISPPSSNGRQLEDTPDLFLTSSVKNSKQEHSCPSTPILKHLIPANLSYILPSPSSATQQSIPLTRRCHSSEELLGEAVTRRNLQQKKSSSMELLSSRETYTFYTLGEI